MKKYREQIIDAGQVSALAGLVLGLAVAMASAETADEVVVETSTSIEEAIEAIDAGESSVELEGPELSPSVAETIDAAETIEDEGWQPAPVPLEVDESDSAEVEVESGKDIVVGTPAVGASGTRHELERVEEIVVRARKRDEYIQETPVAVTAVREPLLRDAGIRRLEDMQKLVPNLKINADRSLLRANVRIRGVGSATPEIAFEPGVGVYVDGVYIPRSFGQLIDVLDVEQIEVLRGPQGTLFGKNTVGGAINIRTTRPTNDFDALFVTGGGNFESYKTRLTVNAPLLKDRAFARFSFASDDRDGFYRNFRQGEDYGDRHRRSFLGSLRFLASDNLTLDLTGSWSRERNNGRAPQCVNVPSGQAFFSGLIPAGLPEACAASRPFSGSTNVSQIAAVDSYGLWGTLNWSLGDMGAFEDMSLKYIASWREQKPQFREDVDGTGIPVTQISNGEGGRDIDGFAGSQRQFSAELQFNASTWDGRLDLVSGIFGFREEGHVGLATLVGEPTTSPVFSNAESLIENATWAAYLQGSADLTELLNLTAGVRFTSDRKESDFRLVPLPSTGSSGSFTEREKTFDQWTPMATLRLLAPERWLADTALDHAMAYATYSWGFRGGGFNSLTNPQAAGLAAFDQELLKNFELGLKTVAFDGRLTANLAAFHGDYDDIQVVQLESFADPSAPSGFGIARVTRNAAKATVQGVELEIGARPISGLQINGSIGLLDAQFDEFCSPSDLLFEQPGHDPACVPSDPTIPNDNTQDRSGHSFINVPKIEAGLGVQYSFPVDLPGPYWMDGWISPRIDWYYSDDYRVFSFDVEELRQSAYHRVDARLNYDFWDDQFQVALWARNLTDEEYFLDGIALADTFGIATRFFEMPRSYGVEASFQY